MTYHASRAHAVWSASASARNFQCAGALALSANIPTEKESIHAARGTAAHEVSERALRDGSDVGMQLGRLIQTKDHLVTVDEEIVESARVYVDYVKKASVFTLAPLWVEQRFDLGSLGGPFEAGGTADAVVYHEDDKRIEVVDLKHGMGVVEANNNPQLRTYALGALLANEQLAVETITVTIVQPRAPHKGGRIRSETFHVTELLDFTTEMLGAMNRSKAAADELETAKGNSVLEEEWADKWLRPGVCHWCPVGARCPKRRKDALQKVDPALVQRFFEDVTPAPSNGLAADDPRQLAKDLDGLDALEEWIKARRALAHSLAEQGTEVPGYVLVEKVGTRKWAADETKVIHDLVFVAGLSPDQLHEKKLKSPAQIDKILGKDKKKIDNMWLKPVTGTNLVKADKTSREPTKSLVEKFFTAEQG